MRTGSLKLTTPLEEVDIERAMWGYPTDPGTANIRWLKNVA